jgi:hypothetical protein
MAAIPFTVGVADTALADLERRLQLTRWPDETGEGTWEHGMPRKVLQYVVEYWRDRFDWRAAERRLNGLPQFTIDIEGRVIHYVHVKGVDYDSAPLVLTHGWPGSFVEMYKVIPMLTDPASNGLPDTAPLMSSSPPCLVSDSRKRLSDQAPAAAPVG